MRQTHQSLKVRRSIKPRYFENVSLKVAVGYLDNESTYLPPLNRLYHCILKHS